MAGERGTLLELSFGDTELVVRRHPDGMITITLPEPFLLLNEDQFFEVLHGFDALKAQLNLHGNDLKALVLANEPLPTPAKPKPKKRRRGGCDHEFADSNICVKCGWNPNGDPVAIVEGAPIATAPLPTQNAAVDAAAVPRARTPRVPRGLAATGRRATRPKGPTTEQPASEGGQARETRPQTPARAAAGRSSGTTPAPAGARPRRRVVPRSNEAVEPKRRSAGAQSK